MTILHEKTLHLFRDAMLLDLHLLMRRNRALQAPRARLLGQDQVMSLLRRLLHAHRFDLHLCNNHHRQVLSVESVDLLQMLISKLALLLSLSTRTSISALLQGASPLILQPLR